MLYSALYGGVDVLAMSCTSLSFTLGPAAVQTELLKGYPSASVATDMASAVVHAIKSVCAQDSECHIALLTPYIKSVHKSGADFLIANGIDIVAEHNMGCLTDMDTSSVNPASIHALSKALVGSASKKVDALFISCSAFRSTGPGFIDELEAAVSIPVITSNQAMMWECLKQCKGIAAEDLRAVKGYGKLFQL